jgi:hypothetical protein
LTSFDQLCKIEEDLRQKMFDKNSFKVDGEVFKGLCDAVDSADHDFEDEPAFYFILTLLTESFEIDPRLCELKSQTMTEIKEKIITDFDPSYCRFSRFKRHEIDAENSSMDEEIGSGNGTEITSEKSVQNETSHDDKHLQQNTEENEEMTTVIPLSDLSIASNLCKLSNESQYDFLDEYFGFTDSAISFITEACSRFSDLTNVFEVIQKVEEKFELDPSVSCSVKYDAEDYYICNKSQKEVDDFFNLSRKLSEHRTLRVNKICEIEENTRSFFLAKVDTHSLEEIAEFEATCKDSRKVLLNDKSGLNFYLSGVDLNLTCKVKRENREKLLTTFYNLNHANIELLMKFCDSKLMEINEESIKPKNLCTVNKDQKMATVKKVTGGENTQIDELEAMCERGFDFRTLLERFVFEFNFARKLRSLKTLCGIGEHFRHDIAINFFKSLKDSDIQELCVDQKRISLTLILKLFYNKLQETHDLVPTSLCLISNSSRYEIIMNALKPDGTDTAKQMEKFCKLSSTYQETLMSVSTHSIVTKLRENDNDDSLWTNVASFIFGKEDCSFLKVESVFEQVLSLNKLRKDEAMKVQQAIDKLKETLKSAMNSTQNIITMYGHVTKNLADYEEQIEAFANFRTIEISVFRSFTMFTGELDSEKFSGPLRMVMLLLFIFFMMITLQNLMNGVALIDAQQIINEAEIIGIKKRISLVFSYENLAATLFKDRATIFSTNIMNRFVLTPSKGRQLVLFDLLKVHKSKTLMLSKKSFEDIANFHDSKK